VETLNNCADNLTRVAYAGEAERR